MKKNLQILNTILHYKQVIGIATALAVLVGIIALVYMPRDEFPEFKIRQGIIVGIFPGATSEEVEAQLTTKVESYLYKYSAVDRSKTYSISKENVMIIYVEVSEKEKDPDLFWVKVRHGLNELKTELPSGVMSLTADNDFGNTSSLLLAVQSDTKNYKELENYLDKFENDVRKIPEVSRIKHFGLLSEQISVYIDEAKIASFGLKPAMVFAALKPQTVGGYAGEVDNGRVVRPIHIQPGYKTESDIANQILYSDPAGTVVRVKDVATVKREYAEPASYIRVNGKKCLIVSLEMQSGNNIVHFGDKVQKEIEKFKGSLPADVHVETISNIPDAVSKAITNFLKEFGIAIVAVILVTLLLLPREVALVAASAIPISIFSTLGVMWVFGIDLQTVSLAALIIVLGMVVDNAIVIIDNYVEKLDHGIAPGTAASQSVTDLFGSVFSATLILIAGFTPIIFFLKGMGGDFVQSLPATIAIALSISLFTAAVLVPALAYHFIKVGIKKGNRKSKKTAMLDAVQRNYDLLIEWAFRNKKLIVAIGAASFIAGLLILSITPQQSFPKFERNQFAVEVYLPEGSSLAQTDLIMKDLEKNLMADKRVKVVTAFVGTSSPRFHSLYAPNFPAKNYGQLVVLTESNEATVNILDEYAVRFRNRYPQADVRWKQLEMAAAKSPIEVRISGDSLQDIKDIANKVNSIVRKSEGIYWVRTDYKQPLQTLKVIPKPDEIARLGYSNTLLNYSLMVGTKGFPVATIWEGDYPVSVNLLVNSKNKTSVDEIENMYVTSPFLISSAQLRQLADVKPGWSEGEIVRRNGQRTISVMADLEKGAFASKILKQIRPQIEALNLPEGVSIQYGGEYQDNKDFLTPFYYAMGVSIAIIFLILIVQFRKSKTAILIMITMPLSVFGAAAGVFITGYAFGVTAFIGLIGLMGMVVRNGIIYISYAEELRHEHGHTLEEAAISAAKRRMRPIFLTAAAAAVGVIPMIASGSSLWGPLGAVICFGLLFGLILSLLVLPVFYYLFHLRDFNKPDAEEVV